MSLEEVLRRMDRIEARLDAINQELSYLKGKVDAEATLIKWVIFPLLIIVAALVGVKLVMPG